jgi:hypothetical protein
MTIESRNSLVVPETQTEQSRSEEASARPEQEKHEEVRVINLESVLVGTDGIYIRFTFKGGGTDESYIRSLGEVQEMVERGGVCISSEGFDDSQGSTVEDNLNKLLEFIKRQEDSLKNTALELSSPDSKNLEAAAGVPNVSTGGQSDEVATQTPGQKPETDTVATQKPEQESDSGGIESRINELIEGLENKDCLEGLSSIESFLNSNEFRRSSVSPAYIQLIANAILEIVNRGIQSEQQSEQLNRGIQSSKQLKFVNRFLVEHPACLDILGAISMESTQTPEALKKEVKGLFIRIRDQVVKFGDLVEKTRDTESISSTPFKIIGVDSLNFLAIIYEKITKGRSQVDEVIKEVFAELFNQWVQAIIDRINQIAGPTLQKVNNNIAKDLERLEEIRKLRYGILSQEELSQEELSQAELSKSEYNSIKNRYENLKKELKEKQSTLREYYSELLSNGPAIDTITERFNTILAIVESSLSGIDQIIDFGML